MKELEILKAILASNFNYNFYDEDIKNVKADITSITYYKENWDSVIKLILYRMLPEGEALKLIQDTANLVIYENSDEEAYRWLDLFLINVLKDGTIILYEDSSSFNKKSTP